MVVEGTRLAPHAQKNLLEDSDMPGFWPFSTRNRIEAAEPETPKKPQVTVFGLLNGAIQRIFREEFRHVPDPRTIDLVGRLGLLSSITLVAGDNHWVAQVLWKEGKVYRVRHEEIPPEETP